MTLQKFSVFKLFSQQTSSCAPAYYAETCNEFAVRNSDS